MRHRPGNDPDSDWHVPEERRRRIADLLRARGSVTIGMLEEEFAISPMTARRDLAELERQGRARRTHGGAVLPELSRHEDSFDQRLERDAEAKQRLAAAAVDLMEPGQSVFLDSSTTAHYVATEIAGRQLKSTVVTNSIAILRVLSEERAHNVDVISSGGSLRRLTLSLVGPHAVRGIMQHFADKVFLSVKGITPSGHLTDPDVLEAEVKRAMITQAAEPVLLVDGSKFEHQGLCSIAHASELNVVLSEGGPEERLRLLEVSGVAVQRVV
jgi:DeoR/GlpR family transcriptional regulator of sugar metabolism